MEDKQLLEQLIIEAQHEGKDENLIIELFLQAEKQFKKIIHLSPLEEYDKRLEEVNQLREEACRKYIYENKLPDWYERKNE